MMGVTERKQYDIDEQTVMKAYKLVKVNAAAAGVDKVSLEAFDLRPHGTRTALGC
ncbi:hypothetical protein [Bradyrhizobium sp. USDA 4529]